MTVAPLAPEFSRVVTLDDLGATPQVLRLVASEAERAALALRFDLIAIDRLEATATVRRIGTDAGVAVEAEFSAAVVQRCILTLEPAPAEISGGFAAELLVEIEDAAEEIDLDPLRDDEPEPLVDRRVDVGELVAEYMCLELDPYPRAPGAVLEAPAEEREPSPFAVLASFRQNP